MYHRLNHLNLCVSYTATGRLIEALSDHHTVPLKKWLAEGVVFKFWGDNVDKKRRVKDPRADHQGHMLHMFSIIVGRSRTPAPELPHTGGSLSALQLLPVGEFLPTSSDITCIKDNLVSIISRILTENIAVLAPLARMVPKHILHGYMHQGDVREVRSICPGCIDEK